jgi:hypothetical protein
MSFSTPDSGYLHSDLAYLLPFVSGQTVFVFGKHPQILEVFAERGLNTIEIAEVRALKNTGLTDHIFIPQISPAKLIQTLPQLTSSLKPGGWMLLGITKGNHRALHTQLKKCGLRLCEKYGVYKNLNIPRYLIEIDSPESNIHFFNAIQVPFSIRSDLARKAALFMIKLNLQNWIYSNQVWVIHNEVA